MKKWYYQLKVQSEKAFDGWATVWFDVVEAETKKDVKTLIEGEHQAVIAEKVARNSNKKIDYRVFITELTPQWESHWLDVRECTVCKSKYDILNSKRNGEEPNHSICSTTCRVQHRKETDFGDYQNGVAYGSFKPCIYKITNKVTNMVYIGQTTQCFTLRWYQHFFQTTDSKFHEAVRVSKPHDWSFEVIEVVEEKDYKQLLNDREQHYINLYNSIDAGYNSVKVRKAA